MGVDPISLTLMAVAAAGATGSYIENKKASKAAQETAQIQKQQADLQGAIQRRESVRQARMARANAMLMAESGGVSASSSAQGAQASIVSQLQSNLSFLDQYNTLSDMAAQSIGRQQKAQSRAQDFAFISNAATQAAGVDWSKYLPKPQPTTGG